MPTVVDLGTLGTQGFMIVGEHGDEYAGWSVSDAGDINGDGFDDVLVGTRAGVAYLVFGQPGGPGNIDLGNPASDGFLIHGDYGDFTGLTVSAAGDVNGDGFDDLAVGGLGYGYYYYGTTPTAYIIFGKASGFGNVNVSTLTASQGFEITAGFQFYSYGDMVVSAAGDVNGDGFDDIIVGSPYDNAAAGAAYVIFGKASGFGTIDLTNLSPAAGFEITGTPGSDDFAGRSVSGAGDVNGDGFDDLIIGVRYGNNGGDYAGEAYVVFGKASGFGTVDLSNLAPGAGFVIQGDEAGDYAGWSVSAAGDVNGDGFDDVIVGVAHADNNHPLAGEAYVIFGKASGFATIDLSNLAPGAGFAIFGDDTADHAGWSVSAAGDVNNDGFADIIVGAPENDQTRDGVRITDGGEAYVIFGRASGFTTIDLTNLSSADGFVIQGEHAYDLAGWSVSTAGDVDGDGFDDLVVGAPFSDHGGAHEVGAAYIISGKLYFGRDVRNDFNGDGRSDILWRNEVGALSEWLGQAGGAFAYNPNAAYQLPINWEVGATGDFNGDSRDDILWRNEVGALSQWLAQPGGTFVYNPNAAYQLTTNWQLSATGDFNGDGRDDIIWRNEVGAMSEWLGQANGTFAYNPNAAYQLPTNWEAAATGDFNGDGRADILWRNEVGAMSQWLGQANGSFVYNGNAAYQLPTNWEVGATGDFNGDGRDDILWRNEVGAMSQWLGQTNGSFVYNPNATYHLPANWEAAATGDFNGDGRDDILWRNEVGAMSQWLGQSDGTFAYNANAAYQLPTNWHVQPEDALL